MRAVLIKPKAKQFLLGMLSFPFKDSHGCRGEFSCVRLAIFNLKNSKSLIYFFRRKMNIAIYKFALKLNLCAMFCSPIGICGAKGVVTL